MSSWASLRPIFQAWSLRCRNTRDTVEATTIAQDAPDDADHPPSLCPTSPCACRPGRCASPDHGACWRSSTVARRSEDEARKRPAPGEWNTLEVVAHLIVTERETHSWLTDMINDDERFSDRYSDSTNVSARLSALLAVHPTTGQLLEAVHDSLYETEEIIEALPDEIVTHRGSYWRIGHNLLQADQHWDEHMSQIKDALRSSHRARAGTSCQPCPEATAGFEPAIGVLQTPPCHLLRRHYGQHLS